MTTAPLRGGQARQDELLAATIDVLRETGYDRLTIDAVVARARASKATVYRRWPNKAALVVAAFTRAIEISQEPPDTGSLREDLVAVLGGLMTELDRLGDVMTGLIGELRRSPELAEAMRGGFIAARRELMMQVFERAKARGEFTGDAYLDTLWYLGPALVFFRTLMLGEPVDSAFVEHVVDDIVLPLLR
ncbi:TetR/AcrR family transcriptional regulator [Amycolatopsis sp. 195334CR]|uniref:TetR/AcrR family transcriptional regulator n=1 Tax=Amycolatopsis sp. 195334CR TaxID=2814588 RepID=UPI001A8E4ABF|nr:TetR/AcrR family transcriptional regulator [Amycolatopsis sp. 195334CR]MBN6038234.1 TetR/AcrR family transcriptional regulator [Amycolatopsis sp. 195334CR]